MIEYTDEQHDSLIRGHRKQLADAQATVEALQAQVSELQRMKKQQIQYATQDALSDARRDIKALRDERDRLRANLVNCVARLEAYYGEDYPAVRDAKAVLTPAGGGQE